MGVQAARAGVTLTAAGWGRAEGAWWASTPGKGRASLSTDSSNNTGDVT